VFADLPLTALRSFESAARRHSFKAAAEELHVTPTAVSHQVKQLETWLGVALFERRPRGVALTTDGERLFCRLHSALLDIVQTVDHLRPQRATGSLTLTTTASFAALWLIPRIGGFYQRHPELTLRIDTNANVVDLNLDASVDLAIRYGGAVPNDLHRQASMKEYFGVYGAPDRLEAEASMASPTLISVAWRDSVLYPRSWAAWCAQAGVDWWHPQAVVRAYDEEHYALHAASAGQGLVLASSVVAAGAVARGLLAPYRPDIVVPGETYHVLCVPGRERHPPVRAFLRWLEAEMSDG